MLSLESALEQVLEGVEPLDSERVALSEAHGRVLAEALRAREPLPPFDTSAMDGYAFAGSGLPERGARIPLAPGLEGRTGHPPPDLPAGAACRIFTGAQLPPGADRVELQENVSVAEGHVLLDQLPKAFANVRRQGEDLAAGASALDAGSELGPFQLSLCASLGHAWLTVVRRPRVVFISTGDELRLPGEPERPGSIPESNAVALAALARTAGAAVQLAPLVRDEREATARALGHALQAADVVVTIGGVSVGDHDLVRPALEEVGVDLRFWKVAVQPGKPLALGRRGRVRVLCVPGNPVSAQLGFLLFGVPLLGALGGRPALQLNIRMATLTEDSSYRGRAGRRRFLRARLSGNRVSLAGNQSSGNVASLAHANALVIVPEAVSELASGADVEVLDLAQPWRSVG